MIVFIELPPIRSRGLLPAPGRRVRVRPVRQGEAGHMPVRLRGRRRQLSVPFR